LHQNHQSKTKRGLLDWKWHTHKWLKNLKVLLRIKIEFQVIMGNNINLPTAKSTSPAATATAEPQEDPPGVHDGIRGLVGVP